MQGGQSDQGGQERIVMVLEVVNGHGNQVGPSAWSRRVLYCFIVYNPKVNQRRRVGVKLPGQLKTLNNHSLELTLRLFSG